LLHGGAALRLVDFAVEDACLDGLDFVIVFRACALAEWEAWRCLLCFLASLEHSLALSFHGP